MEEKDKNQIVASSNAIGSCVEKQIYEFDDKFADFNYSDSAFTYDISEVKNSDFIGKPIKICAIIFQISDPYPILHIEDETEYEFTGYDIVLKDQDGAEIHCFPINHATFKDQLHLYHKSKRFFIFNGTIFSVVLPGGGGYYFNLNWIACCR